MHSVIVFGNDHHNALGILRMLGKYEFDVLFLMHGKSNGIATASKYCKKIKAVNTIQEGINFLIDNIAHDNEKPVLLFTADRYSEAANNNLDILKGHYFVAGPSEKGKLKLIDDKYEMGQLAESCGIVTPRTYLYPTTPLSYISDEKMVIKSCSPTKKDIKVKILNNLSELEKITPRLLKGRRYVVQQYITKVADGLIYGCRTWGGETKLAGICIRNRWSSDGCGSFGYITSEIPVSINQMGIASFLEIIDFRGLFSVEFALTSDGSAYFYEFNLRNDGTSVLFYNAGANVALEFVNSCFGIKEDVPTTVKDGHHVLINEIWDKYNIGDKIVTKKQQREDMRKASIFFYYDPDDNVPYLIQKKQNFRRDLKMFISRTWINRVRLRIKKCRY